MINTTNMKNILNFRSQNNSPINIAITSSENQPFNKREVIRNSPFIRISRDILNLSSQNLQANYSKFLESPNLHELI